MDETSVCLVPGVARGNIFFRKRRSPPTEEPVQRAKRSKQRTCLTHVAFVCDRTDLQPLLPQVLIGNCATFLQRDWAALTAACPANVHLIRQKSAWNNHETFSRIIRMVAAALRPNLDRFQPILFMDAFRPHLHKRVLNTCHAVGIWPIILPAKLTWLLQPCDTHAFQAYKLHLRAVYQARRGESATGELTVSEFLPCVYDTIRAVLQGKRWSTAFDSDGFGQQQAALSVYVQRQMQVDGPPAVPSCEPSAAQISLCLPARAGIPAADFLRPFRAPRGVPALPPAVPVGRRLLPPRRGAIAPAPSAGAVLVPRAVVGKGSGGEVVAVARATRAPRTRAEHRAAAAASSTSAGT